MGRIRALLLALYAAFVLTVLPSYFLSFPLPEFVPKITATAGFLFFCAGCWSFGRFFRRRIFEFFGPTPNEIPFWFRNAADVFMGYGVLALSTLILGWILPGAMKIKFAAISIVMGVLIGRNALRAPRPSITPLTFTPLEGVCAAIAFAASLCVFVSCFSPITYYDSLVYHIALPALYNRTGAITAVPFNLYSYFPANSEMVFLYLLNQMPQPEYVINLSGWMLSVFIGAVTAEWAYEFGGKRAAIFALVLWWTMPAVLFLSLGAYVDLPLSGFILLSVRAFLLAERSDRSSPLLLLTGLFCGWAFATKYTGAICGILLTLYLILDFVFKRPIRTLNLKKTGLFFIGAGIPSALWLIKNFLSTGNPVFPFFYRYLGQPDGWNSETAASYFRLLTEYDNKSSVLSALLHAPWSLSASAVSYGGGFDVLGDFGWPIFLFGAPLVFIFLFKNKEARLIGIYSCAHFLFWFSSKPVLRFLISLLPILVVLASVALEQLGQFKSKIIHSITATLVIPWLFSNFFLYFYINDALRPFSVALGLQTRDVYLSRRLAYYPSFKFANENIGKNDRVLLLGEQRTYHLEVPFIASNLFASSPVAEAANSAKSTADLNAFFKKNNVGYALVNQAEIQRLGGLSVFGFDANGQNMLKNFLKERAGVLDENQHVFIYRIFG